MLRSMMFSLCVFGVLVLFTQAAVFGTTQQLMLSSLPWPLTTAALEVIENHHLKGVFCY